MVEERDRVDIFRTYERQIDDRTWRLIELAGKGSIKNNSKMSGLCCWLSVGTVRLDLKHKKIE